MTPEAEIHLWMVAIGYPLLAVLRLALCIYGVIRTRLQTVFWIWSVAAFLSLAVSLFSHTQQKIIPAVGSFPFLRFLWPVAATADYTSLALNLIGLVLLIRLSSIKPNASVA